MVAARPEPLLESDVGKEKGDSGDPFIFLGLAEKTVRVAGHVDHSSLLAVRRGLQVAFVEFDPQSARVYSFHLRVVESGFHNCPKIFKNFLGRFLI